MIAAVIALAAAVAALVALLAYAVYQLVAARKDSERWHADAVASDASLIVSNANAKSEYLRAETERKRADGLYDQLTRFRSALAAPKPCERCGHLADLSGFVLRLWADDEPTDPRRDRSEPVHPRADAAPAVLGDGLINPEE